MMRVVQWSCALTILLTFLCFTTIESRRIGGGSGRRTWGSSSSTHSKPKYTPSSSNVHHSLSYTPHESSGVHSRRPSAPPAPSGNVYKPAQSGSRPGQEGTVHRDVGWNVGSGQPGNTGNIGWNVGNTGHTNQGNIGWNTGAGAPPPRPGAGSPSSSVGVGGPPPRTSAGAPPPYPGAGAPPPYPGHSGTHGSNAGPPPPYPGYPGSHGSNVGPPPPYPGYPGGSHGAPPPYPGYSGSHGSMGAPPPYPGYNAQYPGYGGYRPQPTYSGGFPVGYPGGYGGGYGGYGTPGFGGGFGGLGGFGGIASGYGGYKKSSGISAGTAISGALLGLTLWNLARDRNHYHVYYPGSYNQPGYSTGNTVSASNLPPDQASFASYIGNMTCITMYNARSVSRWANNTLQDFHNAYPKTPFPGSENGTMGYNFTVVPGDVIHREPMTMTCCATAGGPVKLDYLSSGKLSDVNCLQQNYIMPFRKLKFIPINATVTNTTNINGTVTDSTTNLNATVTNSTTVNATVTNSTTNLNSTDLYNIMIGTAPAPNITTVLSTNSTAPDSGNVTLVNADGSNQNMSVQTTAGTTINNVEVTTIKT